MMVTFFWLNNDYNTVWEGNGCRCSRFLVKKKAFSLKTPMSTFLWHESWHLGISRQVLDWTPDPQSNQSPALQHVGFFEHAYRHCSLHIRLSGRSSAAWLIWPEWVCGARRYVTCQWTRRQMFITINSPTLLTWSIQATVKTPPEM